MEMFLDMWRTSPLGVVVLAVPVLIFVGFVISAAADVIQMVINGAVRILHGHPQAGLNSDDLDAVAKGLHARLAGPIHLSDETIGRLAKRTANEWAALPNDPECDEALLARIEKLAREIAWEQTDVFAAKVMELADKRRAERERAKQAEIVRPTSATLEGFHVVGPAVPAEPAATPEPEPELAKFGEGDYVCLSDDKTYTGVIVARNEDEDSDDEKAWDIAWCDGEPCFEYESKLLLLMKSPPVPAAT